MTTNATAYLDWQREWMIWSILLIPALFTAIYWHELPAQLPVHWNLRGEVDGYGPKYLLPLINVGAYILMTLVPLVDPRRRNYTRFARSFFYIRALIVLFLAFLNLLSIYQALGYALPAVRLIMVGIFLLLALLGNYFANIRPNYFVGIRLPWTLEDEAVWRATHRLTARLWFGLGLVGVLLALLLPLTMLPWMAGVLIFIHVLVPVVYAYRYYHERHSTG